MYADDVIFLSEWDVGSASNLIGLLRCFYVTSGLKINVSKSKILGVGVPKSEVEVMAGTLGCGIAENPFMYLGVPVGCIMAHTKNWNKVVEKFKTKLSSWNAKMLSVGGRLALIKAVLGNLPIYYLSVYRIPVAVEKILESLRSNFFIGADMEERKMVWVAWRKCMASKESGGLGIGSIFALNRALLFKWIWRFRNQPEDI